MSESIWWGLYAASVLVAYIALLSRWLHVRTRDDNAPTWREPEHIAMVLAWFTVALFWPAVVFVWLYILIAYRIASAMDRRDNV